MSVCLCVYLCVWLLLGLISFIVLSFSCCCLMRNKLYINTHADGTYVGREFCGDYLSVCTFAIFVSFSVRYLKTDAARTTRLGTDIVHHPRVLKPIYFGVKRLNVKVTRHTKMPVWDMALLWVLASSSYVLRGLKYTVIIIIITRMIFMVLSSWQSHCESSPGSFNECRLSAEVAANPQTKPTDLDCESARKKWQLPSTSTIAI